MLEKDIADNRAIGDAGAKAILSHCPRDNMVRILTHCNTGSLATAGYGTALGVIRSLHSLKRLGKYQLHTIHCIYFVMFIVCSHQKRKILCPELECNNSFFRLFQLNGVILVISCIIVYYSAC
jgi:hypothetical protein